VNRTIGNHVISTTLGASVQAFVPHPLPPVEPALAPEAYTDLNHQAELAMARLSGVSGLVPSVDWLPYSAIRKEALLTSQIEGTQATLTDLFDEEAGFAVSNTDDVEEATNYLRAFRLVQDNLRDPDGPPISVRLLCEAHRVLLDGMRGCRPAARGTAAFPELDRRHPSGQRRFRAAASRPGGRSAGRPGAIHSR
jgi:Fic family protein